MGNKVNPVGFRIGKLTTWTSKWFANDKDYKTLVLEDAKLRELLMGKLKSAGITKIEIARIMNKIMITVKVARPGVVIGRGGSGLELLKKFIESEILKMKKTKDFKVELSVKEVKQPDLDAQLVAQSISDQIMRRLPAKRIAKQTIERVMEAGAKGIRVVIVGRIGGADIARREKYSAGTVPLQTIKADIDFAIAPALTKSGYVGVRVWIYRGKKDKKDKKDLN